MRAPILRAGGAGPVRVGQAGERAVGDIGPKTKININGRNRIPDGITRDAVSEVKNVKKLSFTKQLRDFADYAKQEGKRFDLYVRKDTELSGPLRDAVGRGDINLRFIPD
ncbi:putative toxin [Botrimarina hoheduenensis]|uniref:putative toxin n=1 Tax=Botrimarina hoheduenensis TaxID=2528000 RepID=UPI0011B61EC4|nr:putative toxin [Botrimarina hoheduenensis]